MDNNSQGPRANAGDPPVRSFLWTSEAMALAGCARRTLGEWMARDLFKWSRAIKVGSGRVRIDRKSFELFLSGGKS